MRLTELARFPLGIRAERPTGRARARASVSRNETFYIWTDGRVGEGANESLIAFKGRAKGIKQRE